MKQFLILILGVAVGVGLAAGMRQAIAQDNPVPAPDPVSVEEPVVNPDPVPAPDPEPEQEPITHTGISLSPIFKSDLVDKELQLNLEIETCAAQRSYLIKKLNHAPLTFSF